MKMKSLQPNKIIGYLKPYQELFKENLEGYVIRNENLVLTKYFGEVFHFKSTHHYPLSIYDKLIGKELELAKDSSNSSFYKIINCEEITYYTDNDRILYFLFPAIHIEMIILLKMFFDCALLEKK